MININTLTRLKVPALLMLLIAAGVVTVTARQAQSTSPPAPTPAPVPAGQVATPPAPAAAQAPAAAPVAPDLKAYRDAIAVKDPTAKLAALRKYQADFPLSGNVEAADTQILDVLLANWPDRLKEITTAFDTVIGNTPVSSPESRIAAATKVIEKGLLLDKAEAIVAASLKEADRNYQLARARTIETQGLIALGKGDATGAEKAFKDALAVNVTLTRSMIELAKIEAKRGNDKVAIDYYMNAAVIGGKLKIADDDALRALYKKAHGSDAGLDAAIDKVYAEKLPNPAKPTPYKPTAARSDRLVLAEMFTGAGCPPCVSADLALDAMLERYPADAIVAIAYHANIPQPDPMVVSGGEVRRKFYGVNGVPTIEIDGMAKVGGGGREDAPHTYAGPGYVPTIDRELEVPAKAAVTVHASSDGAKIKVTATASKVDPVAMVIPPPPGGGAGTATAGPRLQIVLAERELRFTGENNVRFHTMVVRGVAGENGGGFALNATGETTAEYTFDLAAIKADLVKTLADEMVKRRKTEETAGRAPGDYRAENHAMVDIDPTQLVVVAFVQDANKNILQAARFDLPGAKPAGGKR